MSFNQKISFCGYNISEFRYYNQFSFVSKGSCKHFCKAGGCITDIPILLGLGVQDQYLLKGNTISYSLIKKSAQLKMDGKIVWVNTWGMPRKIADGHIFVDIARPHRLFLPPLSWRNFITSLFNNQRINHFDFLTRLRRKLVKLLWLRWKTQPGTAALLSTHSTRTNKVLCFFWNRRSLIYWKDLYGYTLYRSETCFEHSGLWEQV